MVIYAMLSAVFVVAKEINPIRMNVELVSPLIVITTCVFGLRSLVPIYVFCFTQIAIYGFDMWTIPYFYAWAILVLMSVPFRAAANPLPHAIISGIFGLIFGALFSVPYFFTAGIGGAIAWWLNGLLFDFIHCASNFILTLVLFKPIYTITRKTLKKIGFI